QPMNVNFGLFPEISVEKPEGVKRFKKVDRNRLKKKAISDRALAAIDLWQVDYLATLSGAPAKNA
ncbi:MAG: hypothetical protein KDJ19_04405, partial [Hyphomicrobiaceae bacterium]|nr:hypothetical protein [Hyphomicrobiaceae bacterium]